ncbi:MAG: hypothetical protein V4649_14465 [Bacteroidota bacterium]
MRNIYITAAIALFTLAGCTKGTDTTTNNTTILPSTVAAYTVDGIHDVTMNIDNYPSYPASMPVTVTYHDSVQKAVTIAISGVPSFVFLGERTGSFSTIEKTGPWTGFPTFTIGLIAYNKNISSAPYMPGTYPITLTATCDGVTKTFSFKLVCL